MKYHFPKRLLSAALTLALLAGLLCTSAFAATYVGATEIAPVGGTDGDGKITVTVYDYAPGNVGDGDKIQNPQGTPVDGVGINALRIGSVVELTTEETPDGGATTQVAFGLGKTMVTALKLDADMAIASNGDISYFKPQDVQKAVENADQAALEELAAGQGSSNKVTGDNGVAEFTGLTYGLYLLAKSKLPAEATTDFAPFLVSVPMYVNDSWTQTVYAYPKVRTGEIETAKKVDDTDKYVNAGQTLNFTITETIPASNATTGANSANNFTKFEITDTNAKKTLNIQTNTLVVKLGNVTLNGADEETYNKADADSKKTYDYFYTYADSSSTPAQSVLTITLTDTGLGKLNLDMTEKQTLTVTYSATVATDVNFESNLENTALLTYRRAGMDATAEDATTNSSSVDLYTYGIDLTKTLSDASDQIGADQITFELYEDSNGALGAKVPVTGSNGIYWQAKTEESPAVAMHVTSGSNSGHVKLYGLEPGTYYLKETATQNGYALLDQPITIVISTSGDVSVSDPTVSATVNNADATVSNGVVQLSVTNTKLTTGFQLPQTGGEGTLLVTAIGLGLLCAAVVLLVVYRKKSRN